MTIRAGIPAAPSAPQYSHRDRLMIGSLLNLHWTVATTGVCLFVIGPQVRWRLPDQFSAAILAAAPQYDTARQTVCAPKRAHIDRDAGRNAPPAFIADSHCTRGGHETDHATRS